MKPPLRGSSAAAVLAVCRTQGNHHYYLMEILWDMQAEFVDEFSGCHLP